MLAQGPTGPKCLHPSIHRESQTKGMGARLPVASTKDQGLILIGSLVIPMADPNLIKWEEWNLRDIWIRKIWVDGRETHPPPQTPGKIVEYVKSFLGPNKALVCLDT